MWLFQYTICMDQEEEQLTDILGVPIVAGSVITYVAVVRGNAELRTAIVRNIKKDTDFWIVQGDRVVEEFQRYAPVRITTLERVTVTPLTEAQLRKNLGLDEDTKA